jgi:predicted deacylase
LIGIIRVLQAQGVLAKTREKEQQNKYKIEAKTKLPGKAKTTHT